MARDPWEELAEELVHGSEEEFVAALTERMLGLLARGCANPDEFYAIASRAREAALGVWAEWSGRDCGSLKRFERPPAVSPSKFISARSRGSIPATETKSFRPVSGCTTVVV